MHSGSHVLAKELQPNAAPVNERHQYCWTAVNINIHAELKSRIKRESQRWHRSPLHLEESGAVAPVLRPRGCPLNAQPLLLQKG